MGGQAFASLDSNSPINVPRMPPDLYGRLRKDMGARLETLFNRVTVPREAPSKLDYGDVDFLVEGIRSPNDANVWDTVQKLLGAELQVSRGDSHSFGIKHPDIANAYVQVDVELCPGNDTPDGAELFEWTRFMKGDSDLPQILGVCHRPLGLTCNDRGLHIRVEEIEPDNKKKALLFLTHNPNEAMEFYGLDTSKYWAGFNDETDLFEWVSKGRFFSWKLFDDRVEKSNDRSRMAKRPMFRRFIQEFMPAHQEAGQLNTWTRQQVLNEALSTFNRHDQYNAMMAEHNAKEAERALWIQIKELLPVTGNSLNTALKGLRRWVDFADGKPFITTSVLDETPMWTSAIRDCESAQETLDWVSRNWQTAKSLEKHRAKESKNAARTE